MKSQLSRATQVGTFKMKEKKPKKQSSKKHQGSQTSAVWVNPNSTFKGPRGGGSWEHRLSSPTAARLLELADLALGSVQPSPWSIRKKKASA